MHTLGEFSFSITISFLNPNPVMNLKLLRNPTPNEDLPKWKQTNRFPLDFMLIGNGMEDVESAELMRMQKNLYPARTHFWDNLNKKLYPYNQWVEEKNEIDV